MRPLARACDYISTVDVDVLHADIDNPRVTEWEGQGANAFEILHASGEGNAKYQALFHPLTTPGATDYRRCFFHATQGEAG